MNKAQINLTKTDFSMKANLPIKEPKILELWKKINITLGIIMILIAFNLIYVYLLK